MDDLSAKLSIDTPDNILLDAEIAGFGTRCIAAIIDYTLIVIIIFIAGYLFLRSLTNSQTTGATTLSVLFQVGLILFYHLFFELIWNGQTPGKRAIGIRVVQSNGLPLTATSAIIRNLVRLFDFLPLFYGVGLIMLFITKHTQRLGDLAARTVVIREQRQLTVKALKENLAVQYLYVKPIEPIPAYIHIERLTAQDHRTVIDYLQRRATMRDRANISQLIAAPIARKMEDPAAEQQISSGAERNEKFLEFIARAFDLAQSKPDQPD